MRVRVNVDGGARGNPGPAGIGIVVYGEAGDVLAERGEYIGEATNNVAEYRALIAGIEEARRLGATEIDLVGDSELVARQIRGEYKVKNAGLKPLHAAAARAFGAFESWSIRNVPREQNEAADLLVNEAIDRALGAGE